MELTNGYLVPVASDYFFLGLVFLCIFFLYTLLGDFGSNSAFDGRSLFDLGRFFGGEIMKLLE